MMAIMRKIERVVANPDYKLLVMWTDGQQMNIDLSSDIVASGVWRQLADPAVFSAVTVTSNGYAIEWPEPADDDGEPLIDIDSDGLYHMAISQLIGPHNDGVLERIAS